MGIYEDLKNGLEEAVAYKKGESMKITKEIWKEIQGVLNKYKIPYTVHYENDDKHIQINLVIPDYFEESKAEWIISSDGYYPYCSNCHQEPDSGKMEDRCPNCGATMIKEVNKC